MCLICLTQLVVAKAATPSKAPAPLVVVIDLHDTMQPTWADVFVNSLARANQRHAAAILINLSSAGGMKQSVDRMVAAMQKSRVPIIVVGATGDTRVTGEALRLMAEADLPLMGHKGYLTPLWTELPRQLTPEQRHAASTSLMHSLADSLNRHHRRLDAVDELSSGIHWFRADEAVSMGFVEGTVEKQADVLRYMKEKGYRKNGETVHLDLTGAHVEQDTPAPQTSLLLALMNPNLCVLLLTLGLLLIYLEINTPGVVVPGVTGVLLVLLSIYGLSRLPLNLYGIALCVLSLVLMALEAKMSSRGLLAMAGVICMMLGFGYLVRGPIPELQVNWGTALGAGLGFGGVTASLMVLGMEARRSKVRTGSEAMLGWLAVAQTPLAPEGHILVRGELWRARMTSKDNPAAAGDYVKVLRADGMLLEVAAVPVAANPPQDAHGGA